MLHMLGGPTRLTRRIKQSVLSSTTQVTCQVTWFLGGIDFMRFQEITNLRLVRSAIGKPIGRRTAEYNTASIK